MPKVEPTTAISAEFEAVALEPPPTANVLFVHHFAILCVPIKFKSGGCHDAFSLRHLLVSVAFSKATQTAIGTNENTIILGKPMASDAGERRRRLLAGPRPWSWRHLFFLSDRTTSVTIGAGGIERHAGDDADPPRHGPLPT